MSWEFDLSGKVALVTGAGTGLGQQMALALARAGAHVIVSGRRHGPIEETKRRIEQDEGSAQAIPADVTSEQDINRLAELVPSLDILVNNAAMAIRRPWTEVPLDEWRQVMAVNVEAPFRLSQVFAPGMSLRSWGRIINVASIYGVVAGDPSRYPGVGLDIPAYFASKHALIGLTRYLAALLGPAGVTVNAVSPGMFPEVRDGVPLNSVRETALREGTPMKRLGSEHDLDGAVIYLASTASDFVTGQNLIVDGGWTVW